MHQAPVIHWFRRDLRLHDNAALGHALQSGHPVAPVFIFDTGILSRLTDKADRRVDFIHRRLRLLADALEERGSGLTVLHGDPVGELCRFASQISAKAIYTNHDYEPAAIARDTNASEALAGLGIRLHTFKDQCIFEKGEVLKDDGKPYTVFTPYSRRWLSKLTPEDLASFPSAELLGHLLPIGTRWFPTLEDIGFQPTDLRIPPSNLVPAQLRDYHKLRDIPSANGTSLMSTHLRFGTVSIRQLAAMAQSANPVFLNELIWRDFFMMILYHFPHVVGGAFRPQYDRIRWETDEENFAAWCQGRTGYPMVDAGMRELNATGLMHNRVRMVTASFLTKHLLLDWRWGEAYFAQKLLDFELSSNNGNWQWAAGTGCDAAPYFRVFSPAAQAEKFDPQSVYIRRWLPEFESAEYPEPIVEAKMARERAIARYKQGLSEG